MDNEIYVIFNEFRNLLFLLLLMPILTINEALLLRPLQIDDARPLAALGNHPEIAANMMNRFPHPYRYADAYNFIQQVALPKADQIYGIVFRGQLIGVCGIHPQEDVRSPNAELGYWLGADFWGQGLMQLALQGLIAYAWEHWPHLQRIYASIFSSNLASQKLILKLGFQQEACFSNAILKNNQLQDELIFARYRP